MITLIVGFATSGFFASMALAVNHPAAKSSSTATTVAVILAVLGFLGTACTGLIAWLARRDLTRANTRREDAETDHTRADTFAIWVNNVAAAEAARSKAMERVGALEQDQAKMSSRLDEMERRLEKADERERHQLARNAAHSVWDELMLRKVASIEPGDLPEPPPLNPID